MCSKHIQKGPNLHIPGVRGGNFDPITYERIDSGNVSSITSETCKSKEVD